MDNTLLGVGLACLIGAIVGGGLKAFGVEVPVLTSIPRQIALGLLGILILAFALKPAFIFGAPPQITGGPISASVSNAPVVVAPGGTSSFTILASASDGTPLADADVDIQGSGTFQDGGTRAVGRTGANGIFKVSWRCPDTGPTLGSTGYAFHIEVSKTGFEPWKADYTIRVAN